MRKTNKIVLYTLLFMFILLLFLLLHKVYATSYYTNECFQQDSLVPICVYSHSSVFDVLEINIAYLEKLFKDTSQPIYLFIDKPYNKEINLPVTTVIYNDDIPYNRRLVHCISQVTQPYMILSQESDILLKYDMSAISTITNIMSSNNIDSVELTANRGNCGDTNKVEISPTVYMVNIKLYEYTFNVQPRIWKTSSAKDLYGTPTEKTYKQAEDDEVQRYIKNNHNTYGLCLSEPIKGYGIHTYNIHSYIDVSPMYTFIHLTKAGKFIRRASDKDIGKADPFIIQTHKDIYDNYVQKSNIQVEPYIS
jgi:hypothetical protein